MSDIWSGRGDAAHPPSLTASGDRAPVLVLRARPARDRCPAATIWQLLTYDEHTRLPVAEVASLWEPASTTVGLRPGPASTVPDRILRWLQTVVDDRAIPTGSAHDYAGPASWHVRPNPLDTANTASPSGSPSPPRTTGVGGTGVQG